MILDAIATHPEKAAAVVMIATDGIYFTSRNPTLDLKISEQMGDWSVSAKHDLTCFKPGVYWDNHSRELINAGKAPKFKARGINAADFARSISSVDAMFDNWNPGCPASDINWPQVKFLSRFSQTSVLQAVMWTAGIAVPYQQNAAYRSHAGTIIQDRELQQDSRPGVKRDPWSIRYHPDGIWRTEPWDHKGYPPSTPYSGRLGSDGEMSAWDEYATPDGSVMLGFREALYSG